MNDPVSLPAALDRFGYKLSPDQIGQLEQYCQLLWSANRQVNLTRHVDYKTFVARDVADVLQLSACIERDEDVLDIGSGGGVPGIVLSILRPDLRMSLCESVAKKARWLDRFVQQLELPVAVFNERADRVLDDLCFDCCIARAVGPLWKLCSWLAPHWPAAGRLLAIKGPTWTTEVSDANERGSLKIIDLTKIVEYPMHDTDATGRHSKSVILELKAKSAPEN